MSRKRHDHRDVRLAIGALRRIVQVLRASANAAEHRVQLTGAQILVLRELAEAPGMSVNELAARTFTDQSSVSIVVRRLVGRGLVAKIAAPDDRRRVRLMLTGPGRVTLRRAPRVAQERLLDAVVALPARDCRVLAHGLRTIARRMGGDGGAAGLLFEDASESRVK
jgi:DNA-binding MarR family transcriptional regulator